MALSAGNIIKWWKMLTGKSVYHVTQGIGHHFSTDEISGYYNDMTAKVTMQPQLLDNDQLPRLSDIYGKDIEFAVGIFQYGLGAWDLYLESKDNRYLNKFNQSVEWAKTHQMENGAWRNFDHVYPTHPFSAMAQGEGASLLLRAYQQTGEANYLEKAGKAIDMMMMPVSEGGTTLYQDSQSILLEYVHRPAVLNGWIFAWFGLYDYVKATGDEGKYKAFLHQSTDTLEKMLPQFTNRYWSMYDLDGRISSPFYHKLHIAQMQALHQLTGREAFARYALKWESYQRNPLKKAAAFVYKASQKIVEKNVP